LNFAPKVGEPEAVQQEMCDLQEIKAIARRVVHSCILFLALGAGDKPTLLNDIGASKSAAKVTVRIQRPIILQAGKAFPGTQFPISSARERQCLSGDMPDETKCRFVVVDVE
jgi:hypothetical protein